MNMIEQELKILMAENEKLIKKVQELSAENRKLKDENQELKKRLK